MQCKNKKQTAEAAVCQRKKYDETCKSILRNRLILAHILHAVVPEYVQIGVEEIAERWIEADSIRADVPVARSEFGCESEIKPEKIEGSSTEDSTIAEGTVLYDVKFRARYPACYGKSMGLTINVEAQEDYRPGYPISTRSIFYTARLLSSQPGTLFSGVNYKKLEKVYSIWICMGKRIPKAEQNTISLYRIQKEDLVGKTAEDIKNYDLQTSVLIRLSRTGERGDTVILNLLQDLFSSTLSKTEKSRRMKDYGISVGTDLGKEFEEMCNLSTGVLEDGIEIGMKKGLEKGIISFITACQELSVSRETAAQKVAEKFELNSERTEEYMKRYWNTDET